MNTGGIVLLVSIILNMIACCAYLFLHYNKSLSYWFLVIVILVSIVLLVTLLVQDCLHVVLSENYSYNTPTNFALVTNILSSINDDSDPDCPQNDTYPRTCVWEDKQIAIDRCEAMDDCKGIFYDKRDTENDEGDDLYVGFRSKRTPQLTTKTDSKI
jgi:hypothetical protein